MEGTLRSDIEGIKQAPHYFGRYLALRSKGDSQSIGNMTYCLALGASGPKAAPTTPKYVHSSWIVCTGRALSPANSLKACKNASS